MNSSGNREGDSGATLAPPPEDDRCRALVQRIAASRHFSKAHQLRDILLYLMNRSLADPAIPIHEQEIACTVLGRKADFNPHEDNIVRVQVSHLRKRLDDYYAAEGAAEEIRVSIPKGGYLPRFEFRSLEPFATSVLAADAPPAPKPHNFLYRPVLLVAIPLILACAGTAWRWLSAPPSREPSTQAVPGVHSDDSDLLWPRLFNARSSTIVVADTCLVMLQDILHIDIALSDYLDGRYPGTLLDRVPNKALQKALRLISTRQYTSLADLNSAQRLSELSHRYSAAAPAIRFARHVNIRDFKAGNFILVGSRRGIPWVRLFESQLNFSMEEDRRTNTYYYRSKNPRPGEPRGWYQEARADGAIDTYANVALVPNLANSGYVLILAGINMEAAEAAGEFVASPDLQKELARILPIIGSRPQLRYFELLLRTRAVGGAARSSQVVASRVLSSPLPGPS